MIEREAEFGLTSVFDGIRSRLEGGYHEEVGRSERLPRNGRTEALAQRFGLSEFEQDLILLAAFAQLEPDASALMIQAQGDAQFHAPSVALAFSLLDDPHWNALAPDRPLRRYELLTLTDGQALTSRQMEVPERVLQFLLGVDTLDESLSWHAHRIPAPRVLARSRLSIADSLIERFTSEHCEEGPTIPQLCGRGHGDKFAIVGAVGALLGVPAFSMTSANLPVSPAERAALTRRWERELRLSECLLLLDAEGASEGPELRQLIAQAEELHGRVIIAAPDPLPLSHRLSVRIDVPRSSSHEQVQLWREALGPLADPLDRAIQRMASHFAMESRAMASVESELRLAVESGRDEDLEALAWQSSRRQARPSMGNLAERIVAQTTWKDLILPSRQIELLRALSAQVKRRAEVYEDWGFADTSRRGLGINALFSGPSGTGKTMAAEILGNALDLDVYRIDLSSVVSKWIGETEKNLRRVFDAAEESCAVLLFDEADALFGKRSEVKESHDRYANIEVSYLLQRLETYRGLAILTTNLKSHIDEAFLRRIRFVVEFPFPDEEHRRAIWERAFPQAVPREDLRIDHLAQLSVAGGSIRNIAINAAFLASEAEMPVSMSLIKRAALAEYAKTGRTLTENELKGWSS